MHDGASGRKMIAFVRASSAAGRATAFCFAGARCLGRASTGLDMLGTRLPVATPSAPRSALVSWRRRLERTRAKLFSKASPKLPPPLPVACAPLSTPVGMEERATGDTRFRITGDLFRVA